MRTQILPPDEGIILRTHALREDDLILRVLLRDQGKLSLVARKGRMTTKKRAFAYDVLDYGTFEFFESQSDLHRLKSFRPSPLFSGLRDSLARLLSAVLITEAIDLLVPDGATETKEYHSLLCGTLKKLCDPLCAPADTTLEGMQDALLLTGIGDPGQGAPQLHELVKKIQDESGRELKSAREFLKFATHSQ